MSEPLPSEPSLQAPAPAVASAEPAFTLDALDLSALLCSRVCHDVINPVGALVNGLEVLEDEDDPSMKEFALDLIKKSARTSSARLQFARIAFGAAGSAGASIDLGDAENVARGALHDEKVQLSFTAPRLLLPKNKVKLLLNLLVVATSTIPRGGTLTAEVRGASTMGTEDKATFHIEAKGSHARVPGGLMALLAGRPETGQVDSHGIQPYYTGLVARAAAMAVTVEPIEGGVAIEASPEPVAAEPLPAA